MTWSLDLVKRRETKGDKWQVGGCKRILSLDDREYSDAFDEEGKTYRCTKATQRRKERKLYIMIWIITITTASTTQQ